MTSPIFLLFCLQNKVFLCFFYVARGCFGAVRSSWYSRRSVESLRTWVSITIRITTVCWTCCHVYIFLFSSSHQLSPIHSASAPTTTLQSTPCRAKTIDNRYKSVPKTPLTDNSHRDVFIKHVLGYLVLSCSSQLFQELIDFLLLELSANKSTSTTRTYIQCIGAIR